MALSTAAQKSNGRFAGGSLRSLKVGATTQSTAIAGTAFDLGAGFSAFSMQLTGVIAASKIQLQGSLNGSNWSVLGSTAGYTSTAGVLLKSTASTPVQFVRLYAVTLTTGASRNVSGWIGVG